MLAEVDTGVLVGVYIGVGVDITGCVAVDVGVAVGAAGVFVGAGAGSLQPGNWNEPIRVSQGEDPVVRTYSFVYQNVQSSTGSTDRLL